MVPTSTFIFLPLRMVQEGETTVMALALRLVLRIVNPGPYSVYGPLAMFHSVVVLVLIISSVNVEPASLKEEPVGITIRVDHIDLPFT
jgi:hypothetical protein